MNLKKSQSLIILFLITWYCKFLFTSESIDQENSYHEKVKTEWYDDDENESDDENSRLRMLHTTHSEIINMVRAEQDNSSRSV